MKVCIPTVSAAGLQARISPHFGRSPFYAIVDVEAGTAESVPNPRSSGCAGAGFAATIVALGADTVICRRMGGHALAALTGGGVRVLATDQWLAADAIAAASVGGLSKLDAGSACVQGR